MTAQEAVSTQTSGRAATGSSGRMIAGRSGPAGAFAPAVNLASPTADYLTAPGQAHPSSWRLRMAATSSADKPWK